MEPVFHQIPLSSTQTDAAADEAFINEMKETSLRYKSFNKHEIKFLYNSLIDNCIYFLETTYESLYSTSLALDRQEFHAFASEIIRKARVTIPLLYSVMYYIKRFRTAVRKCPKVILGLNQGVSIKQPKDLYKIFTIAAVLSLKFFNDRVILNHEWTKFLNITVEEVNLCERQYFKLIDYNLNLSSKNYYTFISDYLNKFNNNANLPAKPSTFKSHSTPIYVTSYENEQPVIAINNQIPNNQPNCTTSNFNTHLSQPNVSGDNGANAFLSITPTPSVCSQSSPYTTIIAGNGDKPLTPNDIYIDNTQQSVYSDPMNVDLSPQKPSGEGDVNNGNNYTNINRNDTQRTLCNDNPMFTMRMSTKPDSPSMSRIERNDTQRTLCNDNIFIGRNDSFNLSNIKRNDTQRTLCNEYNSREVSPSDITYSAYYPLNSPNDGDGNIHSAEYHPSDDEILRENLNNNTNIPLNKLLYNLHHYHTKNTQQNINNNNQYSSMHSLSYYY
ncbi:hypothetical protein PIROE2DRAFT_6173 [Piromyces sp. E2]|nr:hypothetical protein PIROE2DRAFT_6173 [Piromyces sp. E2]|eukprot:OUM66552.1 hypothetical protein PIROE2DRAFT_6173 [Piromyces sp. E2]